MHPQRLDDPVWVIQAVCHKPLQLVHVLDHRLYLATESLLQPEALERPDLSARDQPTVLRHLLRVPVPQPIGPVSYLSATSAPVERVVDVLQVILGPTAAIEPLPYSSRLVRVPNLERQVAQVRVPVAATAADRLQIGRAEPRQRAPVRPEDGGLALEDEVLEAEESFAEDWLEGMATRACGGVTEVDRLCYGGGAPEGDEEVVLEGQVAELDGVEPGAGRECVPEGYSPCVAAELDRGQEPVG